MRGRRFEDLLRLAFPILVGASGGQVDHCARAAGDKHRDTGDYVTTVVRLVSLPPCAVLTPSLRAEQTTGGAISLRLLLQSVTRWKERSLRPISKEKA